MRNESQCNTSRSSSSVHRGLETGFTTAMATNAFQACHLPPVHLTLVRSLFAEQGPGEWGELFSAQGLADGVRDLMIHGHQLVAHDRVVFDNMIIDDGIPMAVYFNDERTLEVRTTFELGHACGVIIWSAVKD